MEHTQTTQRVVDAATLILESAAASTEQTGCQTTPAFTTAETRAAETYRLTTAELAQAARIATRAAFVAGSYSINAMTDPAIRTAALRGAIRYIDLTDQPCSTESAPRSPAAAPTPRHSPPRTSPGSARHSAPHVAAWRRFVPSLSRKSTASTEKRPAADHIA